MGVLACEWAKVKMVDDDWCRKMTPLSNDQPVREPLRLHIGGLALKPGWKILDIQQWPGVDFVGSCTDLSQFADGSVEQVYASHVLEHLGYHDELPQALREIHRVLRPGGELLISVPNLEVLCKLFLRPDLTGERRFKIMQVMFGAQVDKHDFHKMGWTLEFALHFLSQAGFSRMDHVSGFGLFNDTSTLQLEGVPVSLNLRAVK
jgi:predicted SAM-dependent methyltransferase